MFWVSVTKPWFCTIPVYSGMIATFLHQIRCKHMWHLGQSEGHDWVPHLESGFQFVPVVLRCKGKSVSSSHPFLRAETIKDRRREPHDLSSPHVRLRKGLTGGLILPLFGSFLFWAASWSCAHPTVALGICYDNWKRWTARARSGMNKSQGFWWVGVGEKDLCWEVSSLKIQPSTHVPSGRRGKAVWADFCLLCWRRKTNSAITGKRELVTTHADNYVKGCLNWLYLLAMHSLVLPSQTSRHHNDGCLR